MGGLIRAVHRIPNSMRFEMAVAPALAFAFGVLTMALWPPATWWKVAIVAVVSGAFGAIIGRRLARRMRALNQERVSRQMETLP